MSPWDLLVSWPRNHPIAVLNRGDGADPLPRWTLVTAPLDPRRLPAKRSVEGDSGADPAVTAWLGEQLPTHSLAVSSLPHEDRPPWTTGRLVLLAYELGARLEPAAVLSDEKGSTPSGVAPGSESGDAWDAWDAWIVDVPWSLVFDHHDRSWHRHGPVPAWAEASLAAATPPSEFRLGPLQPIESDRWYESIVERCVELVHAGDLFQANLSRGFEAELDGDPRSLAAAVLAGAPRFGAYVETSANEAVLSASPEMLASVEPGGVVRSCPIKGTRTADADLDAFAANPKDAAELAMIVDLMRNDLGRICRAGSIRVVEPRRFERHPTIVHGVAEIEGRLRDDVTPSSMLQAIFPAGSISGAPKIRAMQVIDTLESARRGIYCGSIGWFGMEGGALLNVAIRTATLARLGTSDRWRLAYRAGCGIVADSDPIAEGRESRDKTRVIGRHATEVTRPVESPAPDAAAAPRLRRSPADPPAWRVPRRR